jgi:hypothetical protein
MLTSFLEENGEIREDLGSKFFDVELALQPFVEQFQSMLFAPDVVLTPEQNANWRRKLYQKVKVIRTSEKRSAQEA